MFSVLLHSCLFQVKLHSKCNQSVDYSFSVSQHKLVTSTPDFVFFVFANDKLMIL